MPEFLSEAWLAQLDDAARAAPAVAGAGQVIVEARVTSATEADVTFRLEVTDDGARVLVGPARAPTVTVVTDRETATALHHGETNAQRALAAGRLKVHGDLASFGRRSDALSALGDVFSPVRAQTSRGSLPA
jgi:putative sterol carrier protein